MAIKIFHSHCRSANRLPSVFKLALLLPLSLSFLPPALAAEIKNLDLKAPIETPGNTPLPEKDQAAMGGLSAPGADAMMTPDMLLVSPKTPNNKPPEPLQAYVGETLKIEIDRADIQFDKLRGVMVTVTNATNRSLVINGEKATAVVDGKTIPVASVATVQLTAVPPHNGKAAEDFLTKILPAAVSVGAVPTIRDIRDIKKPIVDRYGADELRRRVEASRFGRRIIWPEEKSQGVLYFDTTSDMGTATISIPASTLFDKPDKSVLTATPKGVPAPAAPTAPPAPTAPASPVEPMTPVAPLR